MIEPSKLVEKAIGRLNATWNSVKRPGVFLRSLGGLYNIHYARVTAHDFIEHVKKSLFGKFYTDVHGGSVGKASIFHAKVVGSNLVLVTFFWVFLLFFL